MSNLPFFTLFSMPKSKPLYDALSTLPPRLKYKILKNFSDEEFPIVRKDSLQDLLDRGTRHMSLTKRLHGHSKLPEYAMQFAKYGSDLHVESCYLVSLMNDVSVLFNQIVEVKGRENLDAALKSGRGCMVLPLHTGPAYAAPPLISALTPATSMFHRMNFADITEAYCPNIGLRGIPAPSPGLLLSAMRTLKSGRTLVMLPEYDPSGIGPFHVPVTFMDTAVMAPTAHALLSQKTGAAALPFTLRSNHDGTFVATFHEPLPAVSSDDDRVTSTQHLWDILEAELNERGIGAWEMWWSFDAMLPPVQSEGRAHETAA